MRKLGNCSLVWHGSVDIQKCERSITALLGVHADGAEARALCQIVVESDSLGKVGAGVQCARALVVVNSGSGEGVLEDPIGTGLGPFKTSNGAVTGRVDSILTTEK
jgi:hypothetical protein